MATALEIQQLYVAYFGRPADAAGLDFWVNTGISTKAFAAEMYKQAEFASVNAGLSVENQINNIYVNLFGRQADAAGLLYWSQLVGTGKIQLASIANDLIASVNLPGGNPPDKAALLSKSSTATTFTAETRKSTASLLAYTPQSSNPWVTGINFEYANTFLDSATATNTPTTAQVNAAISLITSGGGAGQTFTLTSSPDNVGLGRNIQYFLAPQVYTPAGTDLVNSLQNEDALIANTQNGTLVTRLDANIGNPFDNGSSVIAPTLIDVDSANLSFSTTNSQFTIDFQDVKGTETANITRISADLRQSLVNLSSEVVNLGIANTSEQAKVSISYLNNELAAANNSVTLTLDAASLASTGSGALSIQATSAVGADLQHQIENYVINTAARSSSIATFATGVSSFDDLVVGERAVSININTSPTASLAIGTLRWLGNRVETNSANGFQVSPVHQVGLNGLGFDNFDQINSITLSGASAVTLANVGTWETEVDSDGDIDFILNASALSGILTVDISNAAASLDSSFTGGSGSDRFYLAGPGSVYIAPSNVYYPAILKAILVGGAAIDSLTVQSSGGGTIDPGVASGGVENLNLVQAISGQNNTFTTTLNSGFTAVTFNNQDTTDVMTNIVTNMNGQSLSVRSTGLNAVGDPATTAQGAVNIAFTQAGVTGGTINLELGHSSDDRAVNDAFSWKNYTGAVSIIDNGAQGTTEAASLNLVVNTAGASGTGAATITVDSGDFETLTTLSSQLSATNTVSIGAQAGSNNSSDYSSVGLNALNSSTYSGGTYLGIQNITFGGATQKAFNITTGGSSDRVDLSFLTTDTSNTTAGLAASQSLFNTVINMGAGSGDELVLSASLADPRVVIVKDPTYDGYFQNWSGIETLTINNRNTPSQSLAFVGLDAYAQAASPNLSVINFNDVNSALAVGFRFLGPLTVNIDNTGTPAPLMATKATTITSYSLNSLTTNINATLRGNDSTFVSTGGNLSNQVNLFYNSITSAGLLLDSVGAAADTDLLAVTSGSLDIVDFNGDLGSTATSGILSVTTGETWTASGQTTIYDFAGVINSVGTSASSLTFNGALETNATGLSIVGSNDGGSLTSAVSNSITVNVGNDSITSGGLNDVISSGAGNDVITYTGSTLVANTLNVDSGSGNDSITSVSTTGDTLTINVGSGNDTSVFGGGTLNYTFASSTAPLVGSATTSEVVLSVGLDSITGLSVSTDSLFLDVDVFGGSIGAAGSALGSTKFSQVASSNALLSSFTDLNNGIVVVQSAANASASIYYVGSTASSKALSSISNLEQAGNAVLIANVSSVTGLFTNTDFVIAA